MKKHVIRYTRQYSDRTRTEAELRQAAENRGDVVLASFGDDGRIDGRGKYAGWRTLLKNLEGIDQVMVGNAGDLPGRKVNDLLAILSTLSDHGVGLHLHQEDIDTAAGAAAVLDLVAAYGRSKLSQAIRHGQAKAVAAGKRIGRPEVPAVIQNRIRVALADGGGIRPTARRFKVSPAYVVNVRRAMMGTEMVAA